MGRPFSLKYQFILNPDIKKIGFYVKSDSNNSAQTVWRYILIISLIIILIALLIILGIILGKKIYGLKRKIRANEMDDDYEYLEGKNTKERDNGNILSNYNTIN